MTGVSFGQYYPSASVVHRLDPRSKLLLSVLFIVCTFLCKTVTAYAFLLAFVVILSVLAKIPLKMLLKSLSGMIFILIFTTVVNVFFTVGEGDVQPLLSLFGGKIEIYLDGIFNAIYMFIRLLSLIIGISLLLTYTTTPLQLTDALEWALSPLKLFKIPVHIFAMMMSITLRFIPTLSEETEKIMNAQRARGNKLTTGKLLSRVKALIPILVPLFVSAINRAMDLASAMECRCYSGQDGRTKLHVLHFRKKDAVAFFVGALFLACILGLNQFSVGVTVL